MLMKNSHFYRTLQYLVDSWTLDSFLYEILASIRCHIAFHTTPTYIDVTSSTILIKWLHLHPSEGLHIQYIGS